MLIGLVTKAQSLDNNTKDDILPSIFYLSFRF